jgi:hypothetical protein
MSRVVVVVPSRGRPNAARDTILSIRETVAMVGTRTIIAVDSDDPTLDEYREMLNVLPARTYRDHPTLVILSPEETGNLVMATNTVSMRVANEDPHSIIGNLGDDHRPRTYGWDKEVIDALSEPGIVYGDDLIHGVNLPSAPFISAQIVLALGWYALPTCDHLYIDDSWRELGIALGRLHFLPDVTIEHMHPAVGKGEWDDGYERANGMAGELHDKAAFDKWMSYGLSGDADRVRRSLEAMVA